MHESKLFKQLIKNHQLNYQLYTGFYNFKFKLLISSSLNLFINV
jgi:hypothetical protein